MAKWRPANGWRKSGFSVECEANDYGAVLAVAEGVSRKKAVNSGRIG